jgi:AcrR family transcriptional regulator
MTIFIREGIHSVTMKEIADEINISIRSLYYYYSNKEDLAVDIQIIAMTRFAIFQDELELDSEKNAFENLAITLTHMLSAIIKQPRYLKYITAFDYYFYNEYPTPKYNQFLNVFKQYSIVLRLLDRANKDGSLETYGGSLFDIFTTIFQSFLAYAQKIIYREKAMASEDISGVGNLELFIQILLEGIKKR